MRRKDYQKPTMKVVKLQHQCHILSSSTYEISVGLKAMDNDADIDDGTLLNGTGILGMGADEDL